MGRGSSTLERFWLSDWSLSVFLGLLVVDGFIINPIVVSSGEPAIVQPVIFSLVLISGISTTLRNRRVSVLVSVLVGVSLALRWANHVHPSLALERTDTVSSLVSVLVLAALILVGVFRPGPISMHRIQGAIAVYLLLAFTWGIAYKLVALSDANAFNFPAAELARHQLLPRLTYFSTVTLTTVGYGDITPVSPLARSLASLEALTGQLFPAILLARLVSLELIHRTQRVPEPGVSRAHDSDAGTP